MSIRRRSDRKIYVEDNLPRFLRGGHPAAAPVITAVTPIAQTLPPPVKLPPRVSLEAKPTPTTPISESRALVVMPKRPAFSFSADGWFFARLIGLAIALNLVLATLLQPSTEHWQSQERLTLQSPERGAHHQAETLEERVITYTRSAALSESTQP